MKTLRLVATVALSLQAWTASSSAQATLPPMSTVAVETPSRASDGAAEQEQARRLFAEAKQLYAAGDYEQALGKLRGSYELAALPGLLFDVAQTLRRLRRCSEARTTLALYLTHEQRPLFLERAEQLRRELVTCEETARAPEPAAHGPARVQQEVAALVMPDRGRWKRRSAWASLGLGLGFAAAGLVLALRGRELAQDVAAAQQWDAESAQKERQGVRSNRAAWSCGSLALALLGSSLTLRWLGRDTSTAGAGAALGWRESF